MKRIVALGAAAALAATLAGCASPSGQEPADSAPNASEQQANQAPAQENKLTVVDSGWSADEQGYVHYGIIIKNEGAQGALFPVIKVTGKDADGAVISSDEQTLMKINPGQELAWGGQAGNGTAPATVEFELSVGSSNWQDADAAEPMFEVSGLSAQDSGYGTVNFVGEVTNLTDADRDQAAVVVLLRDEAGAIVGGYTSFVSNVPAGGTTSFDVLGYGVPAYDAIEGSAQPW
ncbi:hypothetical protein H8S61_09660 [Eggerthella sp. NSJ-70]|uniref:Lipoprotein n=1 Tax=Eggerthella hominis TaxID=2763043 RepID=A0ABR7BS87_9ACTN|nr:FxLYD domain-containing protein [Eggerthella hominis]MBC5584461.1 hypothetical protein [Eggerthella hominis]